MTLVIVLAIGVVFALWKILDHEAHARRVDQEPTTALVTRANCSVLTCDGDGSEWSINGWQLCTEHVMPIIARRDR